MPCNFLCLKLCAKKWCISAMTFFHQDTKVFSVLKWILSRVFIVGGWSLTWRTMFSHVMSVIKKWGPLPNCSALKSYQAGSPMEKVHLDFLGPLPRTENGNEYILMMVESFTKWVECVPLPSQTAEVTARAAINEFLSRFGYPYEVFTDQGRNFESELFRKMCEILWIHKTRTTPYRQSGNGQVERYNRTLMVLHWWLS